MATSVGIDDLSVYIPPLYLSIEDLAQARDIAYAKLNKGLGLEAMAVTDVDEDAATLMANAILDLIQKNELDPRTIGRIYLGTESALDGAKPTATYALDMLRTVLDRTYGDDCLLHCDVVDMTFACIGAVDALQNTLDWVRAGQDRIGIVVASDIAKYELGSGGEYTQGAGAVAMLVKEQPRLLRFSDQWGVATRPVHDFFKPRRRVPRSALIQEVLAAADRNHVDIDAMLQSFDRTVTVNGIIDSNTAHWELHRDTPVFDGPYSNDCYQERIGQALAHYRQQNGMPTDAPVVDAWSRLVFHLPYAYQARRMFGEIFTRESQLRGDFADWAEQIGQDEPQPGGYTDRLALHKARASYWRAVTKTAKYREFVAKKIAPGERASQQIGNLYTASLWVALASTLAEAYTAADDLTGKQLGFFAYGSGSKSKVFAAEVMPGWRDLTERLDLWVRLADRTRIDYLTYEQLHRGTLTKAVANRSGSFRLANIRTEHDEREGARTYAVVNGRTVDNNR